MMVACISTQISSLSGRDSWLTPLLDSRMGINLSSPENHMLFPILPGLSVGVFHSGYLSKVLFVLPSKFCLFLFW